MLKRSLIAGVIAIACGVFSTHAQQANRPAQTPAPQGPSSDGLRPGAPATTPDRRRPRAPAVPARAAAVPAVATISDAEQKAFLNQYCVACHSERAKAAGMDSARKLAVDGLDPANLAHDAKTWELIVRKLRAGMMPPAGLKRPEPAAFSAMIGSFEQELDAAAVPFTPAPGLHRLNRTEYANVVRDLLDLDIDASKYLPSDDSTSGFDNIAGALGLSSTLVEAYVVGGAEDQPPGARLPRAADPGGLPHARRHVAGLPPRRHAVRHARRPRRAAPLSVRRRISDDRHADLRRQHVAHRLRLGAVRADRDAARRRAPVARGLGGRRPAGGGQLRAGPPGAARHHVRRPGGAGSLLRRARRRADARALQDHRGHARRRRHVPGHQLRAAARPRQALHARHAADGPDARLHVLPAHRHDPHRGSVRGHAGRRLAEPAQDLRLHAEDRGGRNRLRPPHRHAAGHVGLPASGRGRRRERPDGVLRLRPQGEELRRRHRDGPGARAGVAAVPLPHRGGAGDGEGRPGVSHQRHRPRLAPVVLPLEHGPGRGAAARGGAGPAAHARGARAAGAPHAQEPEGRGDGRELRRPVAQPARARRHVAAAAHLPRLRRPAAPGDAPRGGADLRHHRARGPQHRRSADRPTIRSSTSGWPSITASRTSPAASSAA